MKGKKKYKGYTIVELLVSMLIVMIVAIAAGVGFVKLGQIESLNREKARTLEALCQRFAWTQPYIAAGYTASTNGVDGRYTNNYVNISYPHIVFGISCETNSFTYVTNTVISVREDGVLQTIVYAGKAVGSRSVTNAMDWLDPLFTYSSASSKQATIIANLNQSSVSVLNGGKAVVLKYQYGIRARSDLSRDLSDRTVTLVVPVKLRNGDYQ